MASEYLKWKYRDVKPDPKPEYSKKVLFRTWWEYNFKWVLLGILAAVLLGLLIRDMFFRTKPDLTVAYITRTALPDPSRERLQAELEKLCEDVNGDGEVVLELEVFEMGFDEQGVANTQQYTAGITRLTAELSARTFFIIILDDPEGFQQRVGELGFLDGTSPDRDKAHEPERWREMVYRWTDCPVLTGLELGSYTLYGEDGEPVEVRDETFLKDMYIAHRVIFEGEKEESYGPGLELWEKLTAGAGINQ